MKIAFQDNSVAGDGSKMRTGFWVWFLYALYASLVLLPSGGWPPAFLIAGLFVLLFARRSAARGRVGAVRKRPPSDPLLSEVGAGLAFLLCIQHGLLQTQTELARGNWLGAVICLGVVTPILGALAAWTAKRISNHLLGVSR